MFFSKVYTALALALLTQGAVLPQVEQVEKRDFTPVSLPFTVKRGVNATLARSIPLSEAFFVSDDTSDNEKRSDSATLTQMDGFYAVTLEIGSNKQQVEVDIDTGSSDLWVNSYDSGCTDCAQYGYYNPTTSTTSEKLSNYPEFYIEYVDQTSTYGDFYLDTVYLSGVAVENTIFANSESPNSGGVGVFGIGYPTDEATELEGFSYTNFPQKLVADGIIPKAAYSLYLNSADATSGTVIFGGYDEAKVDGSLVTLPITSKYYLSVEFDSFTLPNGNKVDATSYTSSGGDPVLDSGTTYFTLPTKLRNLVLKGIGANTNTFLMSCSPSGSLRLNFGGGFSVSIPLTDLIYLYKGQCYFSIQSGDDFIFGDAILRYMYIIYDLEENTISLGKVNFTSDSNVVAIP